MYNSLVMYCLDKELKRIDRNSSCITSLETMPSDLRCEFYKLAKLSYKGLLAKKITFSSDDFPEMDTMSCKSTRDLGFFYIIKVKTVRSCVSDNFSSPHLTFQAYLSAHYLAHKSPAERQSFHC